MASVQHQGTGSTPGPAPWVKGSGIAAAAAAYVGPLAWELHVPQGSQKRKKKSFLNVTAHTHKISAILKKYLAHIFPMFL